MEDLGVDLSLLEDLLWDLAVLTRRTLHQIDDVVDTTVLESVLLLLVASVHDGGCQVICCLSLDDEIKDVVGVNVGVCFLLGCFLPATFLFLWCRLIESEHP